MKYDRMKYAFERREWVKLVDEKLPAMEEHASFLQEEAQRVWGDLQRMPMHYRAVGFYQELVSDCYKVAQVELWKCIFYKAMREANRDEQS